jgi:2-polyprenyl-6-methoxyphenol hydroxylase-like FAD-dependent oxidoreductase
MSELGKPDVDVLVVGAGPVGLALACELRRHGVSCRIIDKAPEPSVHSKALGVQARTLEVFEQMGIVEEALSKGKKVYGMNIYAEQRRIVHVTLDDLDTPYPFVLILPQSDTERLLIGLHARLGGQVERPIELTALAADDDGVTATLRNAMGQDQEVRCRWLMGCDGARSTVRRLLELPFEGATYEEHFMLSDLSIDWSFADDEVCAFLSEEGPAVAFPMPGPHRYRLVTLLDPAAPVPEGTDAVLAFWRSVLESRKVHDIRLHDPIWISSFRIHRRQVPQYRVGRCFVMGDAAHIHSPIGGQGMNTGIQDAVNLAWKVALVSAGAARESLLDTFQTERHPVAAAVLHGTNLATRAIALRHPLAQKMRNTLMSFLSSLSMVQRRVGSALSEMDVNYRGSPLVAEDRASLLQTLAAGRLPYLGEFLDFGSAPAAGDRAPDAHLAAVDGTPARRLFEIWRGTGHTLLLFAGTAPRPEGYRHLETIAERVEGRHGKWITSHLVVPQATPPEFLRGKKGLLLDADKALHQRYGADVECLYLIRPDGYVGYRGQPADSDKLFQYLERIFV